MLKLFLKLAVVALLANAAYRVGLEYLTYVKFRDAVRDAAIYKTNDDEDLRKRIMELAGDYDIPLSTRMPSRFDRRRSSGDGRWQLSRSRSRSCPSFSIHWPFTWSIEAMTPAERCRSSRASQ